MGEAATSGHKLTLAEDAARAGRTGEAADLLREIIDDDPSDLMALQTLGSLLCRAGELEEGVRQFERMLRIQPDNHQALNAMGIALGELGRLPEARESFERALSLAPREGEYWHHRGVVFLHLGEFAEATRNFRTAQECGLESAVLYVSFGLVLFRSARHRDALGMFAHALTLDPGNARANYFAGECHLALGDYANGWTGFEARRKFLGQLADGNFAAPLWTGGVPNVPSVILVQSEQRFGDTLQFCRYVPLLARMGKVIFAVPLSLGRLLSGLEDAAVSVIPSGEEPPRHDAWIPLMSLPLAFGTTIETIPAAVPYLHADSNQSAAWREYLTSLPGRKIGLVWAGSRYDGGPGDGHIDRRRSITLGHFAPLSDVPGLCLVSLQKGEPAAQAGTPPDGMVLHDWTDDLEDFADTAALVEALDLVITIDTSVAHLAGALGVPVWVLTLHDHCWRWLIGRTDSPWYPTLRIFQQPAPGDWESVIRAVVDALRAGQ